MIKLRNARTGGDMWVHESRLDEYLAAGHTLAAAPTPPMPEKKAPAKKAPAKKTAAKAAPAKAEKKDQETEPKEG